MAGISWSPVPFTERDEGSQGHQMGLNSVVAVLLSGRKRDEAQQAISTKGDKLEKRLKMSGILEEQRKL